MLFVDGLRYDIAKLLAEKINSAGLDAVIEGRWSPVPTVTPTGKAVVAPVGDLKGTIEDARDGFKPRLPGNQSFNENSLKNLITKNSWQYLRLPEFGNPSGYAWASYGDLDNLGHSIGWKMIKTLENQLEDIVQNIIQLFSFGWKCMKIVTDHGWLLMPGGLSFTTLPTGLTQDKSSRCCLLKEGVTIDFLHLPWSFSGDVHVAFAPGISAFSNTEYAHGGISLQECIVPTLTVTAETKSRKEFKIEKIDWKGMRCRVTLSQIRKSFSIDIRLQPLDSSSSLLSEIKQCKEDSPIVSIPVENDDAEGKNGFIVVLDENGNMITEAPTVIGGN